MKEPKKGRSRMIIFSASPYRIASRTILPISDEASSMLLSRGINCIRGFLDGKPFNAVLEPDGRGGHWFSPDEELLPAADVVSGITAELVIEQTDDWPEPDIPADWRRALADDSVARVTWNATTPLARWDWLRWINSTMNTETRIKRIHAALDKLARGEKRPCCFNRNLCCVPSVSKSGKLIL